MFGVTGMGTLGKFVGLNVPDANPKLAPSRCYGEKAIDQKNAGRIVDVG